MSLSFDWRLRTEAVPVTTPPFRSPEVERQAPDFLVELSFRRHGLLVMMWLTRSDPSGKVQARYYLVVWRRRFRRFQPVARRLR